MFRKLTSEEEERFRRHAGASPPPDLAKWYLYHPVCREVWEARGIKPVCVCCVEPKADAVILCINLQPICEECAPEYRREIEERGR